MKITRLRKDKVMVTVSELQAWLGTLYPTDRVGIDEGGLTLRHETTEEVYFEVGGIPADEKTSEEGGQP